MDDLSSVTERRKRCCELVDLRTEKLNQMLEIIKCEQYTMQVNRKQIPKICLKYIFILFTLSDIPENI